MKKHTYKIWSRKGNCPGCNAGTGCNHRGMCWKRAEMLMMDKLLKDNWFNKLRRKVKSLWNN